MWIQVVEENILSCFCTYYNCLKHVLNSFSNTHLQWVFVKFWNKIGCILNRHCEFEAFISDMMTTWYNMTQFFIMVRHHAFSNIILVWILSVTQRLLKVASCMLHLIQSFSAFVTCFPIDPTMIVIVTVHSMGLFNVFCYIEWSKLHWVK